MLKKGFTLSEVLITLVIIGIIAGLTVPVLIQHHKRVQTAAKLKKTYSAIAQAVKLAETEHGVPSYELSHMGSHSGYAYWENNIEKYLPAGERQTYECNDSSCYSLWYLNDGTGLFLQGGWTSSGYVVYTIDTNGSKGPNRAGRDRFQISILADKQAFDEYPNKKLETIMPYMINERLKQTTPITREDLLSDCKNYPGTCLALIMNDGWEIKSDYPGKL